jgi:hypothetical protein
MTGASLPPPTHAAASRTISGLSKGKADSTMTVRPRLRHTKRALLVLASAVALAAGALCGKTTPPGSSSPRGRDGS